MTVYRRPAGTQLHLSPCSQAPKLVPVKVSIFDLLQAPVHDSCFHFDPFPYLQREVIAAAVGLMEQLDTLASIESCTGPSRSEAVGTLLRSLSRLRSHLRVLTRAHASSGAPVLTEEQAGDIVARIERVANAARKEREHAKLLALVARRFAAYPPDGSREALGVTPGSSLGVVLISWWRIYRDVLANGGDLGEAEAAVHRAMVRQVANPPSEAVDAGVRALLSAWRAAVEAGLAGGTAPVLLRITGRLEGPCADLINGGYHSFEEPPSFRSPVLLAVPEVLAQELVLSEARPPEWLGPAGSDPESLIEIYEALFGDRTPSEAYELAFAVTNRAVADGAGAAPCPAR